MKLRCFHVIALLIAVLTIAAGTVFAQSESQIASDEVKRVGSHLNCQCGGCKDDANCMMSGGQCHFCKPARTKIFQMQQTGSDDGTIIASFVKEYGEKIFRPDPSSSFWVVPYLSFGAGALLVVLILMKMRGSAKQHALSPAGGVGAVDPMLAKYHDAIEKDLARLE